MGERSRMTSIRSCDQCRHRKVKCLFTSEGTSRSGRCNRCLYNDLPCTYKEVPKKRGPPTGRRLKDLRAKVSQDSPGLEKLMAGNKSLSPDVEPQQDETQENQRILDSIEAYFVFYHGACPVLSKEGLIQGLQDGRMAEDSFRCLIYAITALDLSCKYRKDPQQEYRNQLLLQVAKIEGVRLRYDFAASPVPIAVVVTSLFLFIAYSVLEQHNRSFLYLSEAIYLYDWVEAPTNDSERAYWQTLECVLFVTESATCEIYGRAAQRRIAKRPSSSTFVSLLDFHQAAGASNEQAAFLLQYLMTYIHSCSSLEELDSLPPIVPLAAFPVQAADVAVTRQWKRAKLVSRNELSGSNEGPYGESNNLNTLRDMAASTLASLASLSDGEMRIVGVGKIAAIAQAFVDRAAKIGYCDYDVLLNQLLSLVARLDVEDQYLTRLKTNLSFSTPLLSMSDPFLLTRSSSDFLATFLYSPPRTPTNSNRLLLPWNSEEVSQAINEPPSDSQIEMMFDEGRATSDYFDFLSLFSSTGT